MTNILSHALAATAFSGLLLLLLVSRQPGRVGATLLLACGLSILWSIVALWPAENIPFTGFTESARVLGWAYFLYTLTNTQAAAYRPELEKRNAQLVKVQLISNSLSGDNNAGANDSLRLRFIVGLAVLQLLSSMAVVSPLQAPAFLNFLLPAIWISSAIIGLAYVESVYRGTPREKRRSIKPLCIGLTCMFLMDFFVFTDTLLFRQINVELWQVRGFFYAFLVPVIALTVARNPIWAVRIHVSRQAVTSSITVIGTGGYLLATALAAYFIKLSGVEWANVAQIAFVLISLVVLFIILVSSRLRAQLSVNVSKHLFNFKYDYRNEWLNFTRILSTGINDAPGAIVHGLMQIMHSDSGVLWAKNSDNEWEMLASRGSLFALQGQAKEWASLEDFLRRTGWIVQIGEYRSHPDRYTGLKLPDPLLDSPDVWLIIPLPDIDDIIGFVIIGRSRAIQTITWEDRDLLKTAGQQAAGLLVQRRSQEALMQARQFEAFSKLSAYVIHDLKNILGQQSLIVSNAAKHKHNPAFVDDVISTVDNSVGRMKLLLEKLREQQTDEDNDSVDLYEALEAAVQLRPHARPTPTLSGMATSVRINANRDKLIRVFGHLIQNAQDATDNHGSIQLTIDVHASVANVVITDTGLGMTDDFIKNSLFKPFISSKGLTGMGIGVYESREYIRKLGGKIAVSSEHKKGTVFTITLPTL